MRISFFHRINKISPLILTKEKVYSKNIFIHQSLFQHEGENLYEEPPRLCWFTPFIRIIIKQRADFRDNHGCHSRFCIEPKKGNHLINDYNCTECKGFLTGRGV